MQKLCEECKRLMEIPEMSKELEKLIGSFKICIDCAETEKIHIINDLKSSFSQKQMELSNRLQKISQYINLAELHLNARQHL